MKYVLIASILCLSACDQLSPDHLTQARNALQQLCTAPPDGLIALLPNIADRNALHLLCGKLGINPAVGQ